MTWTDQMLDRFMVAEIVLDELATIADEFSDLFTSEEDNAIFVLRRGAWRGFVDEPLAARRDRMERIRDALQDQFPCSARTHEEAAERAKGGDA